MSSTKSEKQRKRPARAGEGRPTDYKPEYAQMLIEHMTSIHSFESFGGVVGVCKQTLYNWTKEHPEFLYAKKIGRLASQRNLENLGKGLMSGKIKGNVAAWIFFMKNCSDWRDDPNAELDDEDEWTIE